MPFIEAREVYRHRDDKLHKAIDEAVNELNSSINQKELWEPPKKQPFDWRGLFFLTSPIWIPVILLTFFGNPTSPNYESPTQTPSSMERTNGTRTTRH